MKNLGCVEARQTACRLLGDWVAPWAMLTVHFHQIYHRDVFIILGVVVLFACRLGLGKSEAALHTGRLPTITSVSIQHVTTALLPAEADFDTSSTMQARCSM